jgi:hypothetical protein
VRSIVSPSVAVVDSSLREKYPMKARNTDLHTYRKSRSQRCPTIVTATCSPTHPSRAPFIAWNPSPASVEVIKIPAAVVKWCPSPVIVGYPGIAKLGHRPVSIGAIRMKVRTYCRKPDKAMSRIAYPVSIRHQFIIKYLKGNAVVGFSFARGGGQKTQGEYAHHQASDPSGEK